MGQEKFYENKIKRYLKEKGCWYVKFFGNSFTKSGIPDLLCCINGKFVAIEVKSNSGKPSELQKYNIEQIHNSGGIALVSYPNDWIHLKQLIDMILENKEV